MWLSRGQRRAVQPGQGPCCPKITLYIYFRGIKHHVVLEERAKRATRLYSHFLPLIHPVSLGFSPVKRDEDSKLSHLTSISNYSCPSSRLVTKIVPATHRVGGNQSSFGYAREGTAKSPILYLVWV